MRLSRILLAALLLASLVALAWVYWPTLPYPLQYDDRANILENRSIRYLSHPRVFWENITSRNRPLTSFSYAVNFALSDLSLSGFRLTNVLLHLASALFVGLLLRRWIGEGPRANFAAAFAGAFFALHPLAVDSVVYLSARSSLLALFLLLLALWFHGRPRPGFFSWAAFLAAAAGALLAKESAVAIVPLVALSHHTLGRRPRELIPYLTPLVVGAVWHAWLKVSYIGNAFSGIYQIQGDWILQGPLEFFRLHLSLWPRLARLFVDPSALAIDHQLALPTTWLDPSVLAGAALWLGFGLLAWWWWRRPTALTLSGLWIFFVLVPTNSIFPLLDPLAERHLYPALAGLAWVIAMLSLKGRRWWGPLFVCLALPFLVWGAKARAADWRSPAVLWGDAYEKAPAKLRIAYNYMIYSFTEIGDGERALATGLKFLANTQAGALPFEQEERMRRAVAGLLRAASGGQEAEVIARTQGLGHGLLIELTRMEALLGLPPEPWWDRWRELQSKFGKEASARDPQLGLNLLNLLAAQYHLARGEEPQARQRLEAVLRQFPERQFPYWTSRELLGDFYLAKGWYSDALAQYEPTAYLYKVYKRFPRELLEKIYRIHVILGDWPRAADALGEMVRVNTDDKKLRALYAEVLLKAGSVNAAQQAREAAYYEHRALSQEPDQNFVRP